MNFIDPNHAKIFGHHPETGPPQARRTMKRQVALCNQHLDMITWNDLFQIIPEANTNPRSDSYDQMAVLVHRLKKEKNNATAAPMLKLLRRLGLALAQS